MKRFLLLFVLLFMAQAHAAVQTIQVTIGASATQISTTGLYCRWVTFQNNTAARAMRLGDSTVTSSVGINLVAGSSLFLPPKPSPYTFNLAEWYVAGTQNDVIDVVCDTVAN